MHGQEEEKEYRVLKRVGTKAPFTEDDLMIFHKDDYPAEEEWETNAVFPKKEGALETYEACEKFLRENTEIPSPAVSEAH